jgi:ABC-type branched-subunit amino acid transport system substrate-binding protein
MTFSHSDSIPKRRTERGLRRTAIFTTVLALVTAWVVAATPSAATTRTAVRAAGVSDDEITVGGLATATNFPQMGKAAQARFDVANEKNEIPGGRKIKYVSTAADEGTPDGALAGVRGLVEQDGVFAIVPAASVFGGPGLTTYLNSKQVPVVGWGILPGMCTKDPKTAYFFAITGCLVQPPEFSYYSDTTQSMTTLLKDLGKPKSIAFVCESYATSVQACARIAAAYKEAGFKVPYAEGELQATGQGDYTPVVQKVLDGKPSAVNMLTTAANGLGMVKALQQAGFTGVIQTVFYAPQLIVPLKDTYTSTSWATPESTAPEMKKAVKTLNDAGITEIGTGELVGYFSADYFIKLLKATGKNLTAQRFRDIAAKFTYELEDVIGPTYYPQGFQVGPSCTSLSKSNGTAWEVAVPYACYPTSLKKQGNGYKQVPYPKGVK